MQINVVYNAVSKNAVIVNNLTNYMQSYKHLCCIYEGALGVICSIMWFFLVYDSPAQHPRISAEERQYIEKALSTKAYEKVRKV